MKLFFFAAILFFSAFKIAASDKTLVNDNNHSVGLVLSGGGAKGFAYIGLLKVLEEVNMPIDYVGGSSIGAIVAGLYSVGYSSDQINALVKAQNWSDVIADVQERKYLAFEEKIFSDKYIFTVPLKEKGISFNQSISGSFNIDLLLNELFAPATHITDFSQLPTPFLCIGTDLFTGEDVVIDSGNLARAIRASMAIPGYFPPTRYKNTYMIDGGVINNYPAEQIKALGINYIIGGDVQSGLKSNIEELSSATGILEQVVAFNRVDANKKGIALTDYYIHFDMVYGMMDFTSYDSIIAVGERVARIHYDDLKNIADSLNKLRNYKPNPLPMTISDTLYLEDVNWPELRWQQRERFTSYFNDHINTHVSFTQLNDWMNRINGSRSFNALHYELEGNKPDSGSVNIYAKSPNRGNLAAGIHYDNVYNGSVLVNASLRNIRGTRAKAFADFVLSQNPRFYGMFIINNGLKPGAGIETDMFRFSFPLYESGQKLNSWQFDLLSGSAFMPMSLGNNFLFKAGFKYEYFRFKQDVVVDTVLDKYNTYTDYGNFFVSFNLDTRDKVYFTEKGQRAELKLKHVFPFSGEWGNFITNATIGYFRYSFNISISNQLSLQPGIFAGYTYHEPIISNLPGEESFGPTAPIQHLFGFGGINPVNYIESHIPFTGLRFIEKIGMYAGAARLHVQYQFYPKFYATFMGDMGFNEFERSNVSLSNAIYGMGIKISYNSFIGPIELSITDSNLSIAPTTFINVGFWF